MKEIPIHDMPVLAALCREAGKEPIMLTLDGRPLAVLSNPDEFRARQAMMGSMAVDSGRLRRIWQNHEAFQQGEREGFVRVDLDQMKQQLDL